MLRGTDLTAVRQTLAAISGAAAKGNSAAFWSALWATPEHLRHYLHSFRLEHAAEDFTEAYVNDALARFIRTLEMVPLPPGGRLLEIGSNPYYFHILLHRFFPHCEIAGVNFFDRNIFSANIGTITQAIGSESFEESYRFTSTLVNLETVEVYPFAAGEFDLVFFCETLEHLAISPLAVFSRLRRIIRPGGHLLVTLPNAVRLTNLALMLEGFNFFDIYSANGIHGRHNREYTLAEMGELLLRNEYEVVRAETHDRFDYDLIDIWSADYSVVGLFESVSLPTLWRCRAAFASAVQWTPWLLSAGSSAPLGLPLSWSLSETSSSLRVSKLSLIRLGGC
jgi:SAM-dependent methyltransferase